MALPGVVDASVAKGQLACKFLEVKKVAVYIYCNTLHIAAFAKFASRTDFYKQLIGRWVL